MRDYSSFAGPSPEELTEAYRRHNERRAARAKQAPNGGLQTNVGRWIGTPRKAKHRPTFTGTKIS